MKGYQGMQQSKNTKLEREYKQKEIDSYDKRIAAELEKIYSSTRSSDAQAQESLARTQQIPLTAEMERALMGQQAASQKADTDKKRFELENYELFLQGAGGDWFRQMHAMEEYNRKFPGQQPAQQSGQSSGGNPSLMPSGQVGTESSEPAGVFEEVLSALPAPEQQRVLNQVPPKDPNSRRQYEMMKSMEYGFLSPETQLSREQEIKKESTTKDELLNKAIPQRTQAQGEIKATLGEIRDIYGKIPEHQKGWVYGNAPAGNKDAQKVDSLVKRLVLTEMQKLKGTGNISDADVRIIETGLPNRRLNEESMEYILDFIGSVTDRQGKSDSFMSNALVDKELPLKTANRMWGQYSLKNPLEILPSKIENLSDEKLAKIAEKRGIK